MTQPNEPTKTWTLIGADGEPYESDVPGAFGGNRRSRVYGRFDCRSSRPALATGGYVANRVFFLDAATAVAAGYRPCGTCLPTEYAAWRAAHPA